MAAAHELPQVGRIVGGLAFDGAGFAPRTVGLAAGRFAEEGEPGGLDLDARGCWVIPGLLDLHFHGANGHDLCDGDARGLADIAAFEARRGVTGICPATMTFPEDRLCAVLANAAAFASACDQAALVGVNLEGPYISPAKVGAQNPAYVRPCDAEEFARLQQAAAGLIRLVDVAPETPGALAFIEQAAPQVRVSVAHTCANYDEAAAAFDAGAAHVTHLFNAMPGLHHRTPGPIAAAAERPWVTPELICDGVHVHPAMVRLAFALFGAERVVLISDSMRACGLADGCYDLGGQQVHVQGPLATLADGTIAGSVTSLMGCLQWAVREAGVPLACAVRAASTNPARALGLEAERGTLAPGAVADAVLLDQETLELRHVVLRGKLLV